MKGFGSRFFHAAFRHTKIEISMWFISFISFKPSKNTTVALSCLSTRIVTVRKANNNYNSLVTIKMYLELFLMLKPCLLTVVVKTSENEGL